MYKSLNIFNFYLISEVIKSVLLGIIFFVVPSSLLVLLGIQTMYLVLPNYLTLILIMWVLNILILNFSISIVFTTLKNYNHKDDLNYRFWYFILFGIGFTAITLIYLVIAILF